MESWSHLDPSHGSGMESSIQGYNQELVVQVRIPKGEPFCRSDHGSELRQREGS